MTAMFLIPPATYSLTNITSSSIVGNGTLYLETWASNVGNGVTIDDIFHDGCSRYRLVITMVAQSSNGVTNRFDMNLRSGGTDIVSGYDYQTQSARLVDQSLFSISYSDGPVIDAVAVIDFANPMLAQPTNFYGSLAAKNATSAYPSEFFCGGYLYTNQRVDGLRISNYTTGITTIDDLYLTMYGYQI